MKRANPALQLLLSCLPMDRFTETATGMLMVESMRFI